MTLLFLLKILILVVNCLLLFILVPIWKINVYSNTGFPLVSIGCWLTGIKTISDKAKNRMFSKYFSTTSCQSLIFSSQPSHCLTVSTLSSYPLWNISEDDISDKTSLWPGQSCNCRQRRSWDSGKIYLYLFYDFDFQPLTFPHFAGKKLCNFRKKWLRNWNPMKNRHIFDKSWSSLTLSKESQAWTFLQLDVQKTGPQTLCLG